VVGEHQDLCASGLRASEVHWLVPDPPRQPRACQVKIRYRANPTPATVQALPGGNASVEFATPVFAVTPGQAVVFYEGDRVLGGGWISKA
jgi:tRNA-specific 2-thiouridylase